MFDRKFREKRKRKFKEITPMPGNKELMLIKILKKGHSYVDIDDYHVMSEKDYYKTMNILKPKFFKLLYSHFLENVKLCENYELVISFDGRWSSRRSGKQCSVNFIIVDGPTVLIGKLLLLISCQKISKKRKEKIENTIFYRYVELKSSQMEGFLVEYACELFKKFKLNIKIIVHETDSKPYKIFKNHFSNVIDDFYDINHFLINYQKKFDKWRKQNADLSSLLRCFALSQGFSFRLKNWIAFSIKNGEKNFDEISALIFKFISHSEGNHYDTRKKIIQKRENSPELRKTMIENAKKFLTKQLTTFINSDLVKIYKEYRTNNNESFNSLIAKKINKNKHYRNSYDIRALFTWYWWNSEKSIDTLYSKINNTQPNKQFKINRVFNKNKKDWVYKPKKK
ncbi:hypothetical protein M0813_15168 [Anaeramoeba flamelloides]|uniref:Uncharacterized protein n=1 Tax=Anaeramoeba flamelloides TaxID=1746091 RepID=A0ABQ8Z3R7_9EUKA|nr:hypothetical protein M0813_15168 [Anaeramoeba flamelloides]